MDSDLRCFFLHHGDPYLRLGPLRYEPLSASPHVAILRNGDLFCDRVTLNSDGRIWLNFSFPIGINLKLKDHSIYARVGILHWLTSEQPVKMFY